MKNRKLNLKLIKFVATLVLVFSLPLIAVGQVILHATTNGNRLPIAGSTPSSSTRSGKPTLPSAGKDWPMYLHDPQRTAASDEAILSPANAGGLTKRWSFKTNAAIAASPVISGGTVYIGSWDGYEYALDAATGALKWKTYLGKTVSDARCDPLILGVTSSAVVQDGVVYVGGGDPNWYALDAETGAILWKVFIGDNSIPGGNYNWASPLLYNGYAYIGVSSNCDDPLIQGKLLQVDLRTHQIVHTLITTPDGTEGAGIWTSPSIDEATNTIFLASGTATLPVDIQPLAQAVIAVDASTLAVKASWRVPDADTVPDSDFATTPILFNDKNGTPLVAAINKNGYIYTFNRGDVGAGPVWKQGIAIAGLCPLCGDGSISNGTYGQHTLYFGGGFASFNGVNYLGSVRALDPATGKFLWQHGTDGSVFGSLTYTNGLIIDGAGSLVEVLDATTGTRLYSYQTGEQIYSAPSVSHGQIFIGSTDGNVYAFGLPDDSQPALAPDAHCPNTWSCQDIGNPIVPGSETLSHGVWSIKAAGTGITGTADQLRFVGQEARGDTQISARVVSQTVTGIGSPAQVGLMIRQSRDPGSPYYAVLFTASSGVVVQYRSAFGGETTRDVQMPGASLALYLEIQRIGDKFQAATSHDGIHYTLLPGSTVTLALPFTVTEGLALSSASSVTLNTAIYSSITVRPAGSPLTTPTTVGCPNGWSCSDIGNPAVVGKQSLSGGTWTIQAGGILSTPVATDQFHYVWQPLIGDGSMSAQVVSQTLTTYHAKAGIMIRQNTGSGSLYYAVYATPFEGITVESRAYTDLPNAQSGSANSADPVYLRVVRRGNTFSAYSSYDGVKWTLVVGSSVTLDMGKQVMVGLAVTSQDVNATSTVTFDTIRRH
jgi:outer membrane protein assembly factor BamB